jgi:hypothetical protein
MLLPDDFPGEDLELELTEPMLQEPPGGLTGLVRIGEVTTLDAVRRADLDSVALDAAVRMLGQDHDFTLVRLPLTIRPTNGVTVGFLAVEVTLTAPDAAAVCWSMDPLRVDDEVKLTTTATVNAKLAVRLPDLAAGSEKKSEYVIRQPRVIAYNVGATDPAWEFVPTRSERLAGVQLLHLVVKSVRGVAWSGAVGVRLDVQARGWPWPFRAVRKNGQAVCAEFSR